MSQIILPARWQKGLIVPGQKAYYDFSQSITVDQSGNGYNLSDTGALRTLKFDRLAYKAVGASTDILDAGTGVIGDTDSFMFWAIVGGSPSAQNIMQRGTDAAWSLTLSTTGSLANFGYVSSSPLAGLGITAYGGIRLNSWNLVAGFLWQKSGFGSTRKIYVNGVIETVTSGNTGMRSSTTGLRIGTVFGTSAESNIAACGVESFGVYDAITEEQATARFFDRLKYLQGEIEPRKKTLYFGVGGGVATLTPSLYVDGDTFHAATVSAGAVTLTTSLYADGDAFHAATVSQTGATQDLTPDLYADGDTFHAATVGRGAVTLTPSLYADGDTFHNATVAAGSVNLAPSLVTDGDTFHAATVAAGSVTLTPSLVSDGDTFYTHAVVLEGGPQTLSPDLFADGDTFHAATVTPGAVTLTPSLYTDPDTFHAAEVASGFNLQPPAYADPDTFYPATVAVGAVSLAPDLFVDGDAFHSPAITFGQVLSPSLFADTDTFHAPSVYLGVRRAVDLLTAPARDATLTATARDTTLESRHAVHG